MHLMPVNPASVPAPEGGYHNGLLVDGATRWLHISGQIPVTPDGRVPEGFADQCTLVWEHVTATLAAARMQVSNLVKVTTYLSDRRYAQTNSGIRSEFLAGHRPALTVVVAEIFDPAWLLEIEAVAAA
jgi:2-iminobutanoate/2-iminopropanoate deaminase